MNLTFTHEKSDHGRRMTIQAVGQTPDGVRWSFTQSTRRENGFTKDGKAKWLKMWRKESYRLFENACAACLFKGSTP